jgi:uncharacterized membrane protein YfcA
MLTVIFIYLGVGAIAGILAGLLGVGGGLVIVPMMVFTLTWQAVPQEHIMHLALGTSLASIIFTSISSFMAHHRRGAVQWQVVRRIVLGILLGTFLGASLASRLSTGVLKAIFVVFLYYMGVQLLLDRKPKVSRTLPGPWGMFGMGNLIGVVSAFVGIGGGSLSVPFMIYCNVPVHSAIGTSAAIGFPIAIAGAVGYLVNGLGVATLPPWSLGYIYLPALLGIAGCSILTAPLGARAAHSLPVGRLKQVFAVLLLFMGTKMVVDLLR